MLFMKLQDIRKQRKMGHITVVGPSMGIVETRVKSFLKEDSSEETPGLFSKNRFF